MCQDLMMDTRWRLPKSWRVLFERSFGCSFEQVSLVVGRETDCRLSALGAEAVAVDQETIWLSTRIQALPQLGSLLVLGHELAHTVQLARRGDDDEKGLEAEAWLAAACALTGVPYVIKGRGAGLLPAVGLYMNISAKEYFETFGVEPLLVPKGNTAKIDPLVFESILDLMTDKFKDEEDFVIEVHGDPSGVGIAIAKGEKAFATTQVLATLPKIVALRDDLNAAGNDLAKLQKIVKDKTLDGNPVSPSDPKNPAAVAAAVQQNRQKIEAEIRRQKRFAGVDDEAMIARLVKKMQDLKNRERNRIELRSCNMGHFPGVMDFFRILFNAKILRAPTNFSAFGQFIPIAPRNMVTYDKFVQQHAKGFVYRLSGDNKFAFDYQPLPGAKANTPSAANSDLAVKEWIKKFMGDAAKIDVSKFPSHFLLTNPPVFPKEANYTSHVKASKKDGN